LDFGKIKTDPNPKAHAPFFGVMMELRGKTVFISGNAKNCGKTTFMNYLTARLPFRDFVRMSIGIDGEKEDAIFAKPKPKILTKKGELVVSTITNLQDSDASFNILQVYDFSTCLGKIAFASTLRDGHIELAGPETNSQLRDITQDIISRGIETIFIDGAVNRITQISGSKGSLFYFVSTVKSSELQYRIDELEKIFLISQLKNISHKDRDMSYIKGALTSSTLSAIDIDKKILIEDMSKVFLPLREVKRLITDKRLFVKNVFKLEAFIVNLYDVSKETFCKNINNKEILEHIIFNPYKEGS